MKRWITVIVAALWIFWPAIAGAVDVNLVWDANAETDLAGYRLYKANVAGGPYVKVGNDILPSAAPTATWTVPAGTESTFYFVVTAYDQAGNESGYSNEVSLFVDNFPPAPPSGLQLIGISQAGIQIITIPSPTP